MSPANASVGMDGFRVYYWEPSEDPKHRPTLEEFGATERTDVLSVTSIRTLAGEPFQLVNWKIANVVNLAMGVRKATRIGPRGGVKQVYVKDGPFPGEFVTRMVSSRGAETTLDEVRRWLRETADEPRDVAAVRGSVVHKLIELNYPLRRVHEAAIRERFDEQWKQERRKVKPDVTDEDVYFVENAMAQYWDMREHVPFVILAQEPQVWNLQAGYAGSADVLMWFLGEWQGDVFVPLPDEIASDWQERADRGKVTLEDVAAVGGRLALGDWKTSPDVYTNHVIQGTAYLSASFVGRDGVIDRRLTELLQATLHGLIIKIRPNGWKVAFFDYREDTVLAYLGSLKFARFLAMHRTPEDLFTNTISGSAKGTDESAEEAA